MNTTSLSPSLHSPAVGSYCLKTTENHRPREPCELQSSHCFCCCSVAKSYLTLCDPMDCNMPGSPVLHYLPEFAQTHIPRVSDATQLSHPLSPPSPPALNYPQHQSFSNFSHLN